MTITPLLEQLNEMLLLDASVYPNSSTPSMTSSFPEDPMTVQRVQSRPHGPSASQVFHLPLRNSNHSISKTNKFFRPSNGRGCFKGDELILCAWNIPARDKTNSPRPSDPRYAPQTRNTMFNGLEIQICKSLQYYVACMMLHSIVYIVQKYTVL
jgi:hypothetical protein